jgi:hypothetical protein
MATRTVRLDDEAEAALREIRNRTGLPISEALKRGLRSLQQEIEGQPVPAPWEAYRQLDIGPGGYAVAPARDYKPALRERLGKKHGR